MAILDLPDEVIRLILDSMDTQPTLISLSTTCKRLNVLSQTYIYSSMEMNAAQGLKFFPMQANQGRLKLFKRLTIDEPGGEMAVGYFSPWIGQMDNLRKLRVISPYWHFSDFGNVESPQRYDEQGRPVLGGSGGVLMDWPHEQEKLHKMFKANSFLTINPAERILPSLRSCYIKYNEQNGQAWFIDFEPIFFSATLLQITLDGCFFHDGDLYDFIDEKQEIRSSLRYSTPLEHLFLLECNINPVALSRIMTIPKALKTLGLSQTESTHHELAPMNMIPINFGTYTDIFQSQKHALESLYLSGLPIFRESELRADFTQLSAVRTILLGYWADDDIQDLARLENWNQSLIFDSVNQDFPEIVLKMPSELQNLRFPELVVDEGYLPLKEYPWMDYFVPRLRWAFHLRRQHCPNLRTLILPVTIDSSSVNTNKHASHSSAMYDYDDSLESLAKGFIWINLIDITQNPLEWNMGNEQLLRDLMKMKQTVENVGFEAQILVRRRPHITISR